MNASETRRRGRYVAAWLAAVALVVIGIAVFNRPQPVSPVANTPVTAPVAPDQGGNEGLSQTSHASDVRIEIRDDETGVITAIMTAERMEPTDETNFIVTAPRLTHFLEGGQTFYIRSDYADIHVPKGQESPDRGTMRGNVETRLFDPMPTGVVVDVERDLPTLTAELETLQFDLTLGQISSEDPIRILGDEFEMQGVGLEWFMNLADSSLNSMRITQGRFAKFIPLGKGSLPARAVSGNAKPAPPPTRQPSPPASGAKQTKKPAANPSPDPEPVTRMYRIDFAGDVVLTQGTYKATADLLSMWVRTIDNALPEGSMPQMKDTKKHTSLSSVTFGPEMVQAITSFVPAALPEKTQPQSATDDEAVPAEIRWTGPMIVTPIVDVPVQLAGGNDIFIRMSANDSGGVVLTDVETGSVVTCDWLEYADTTQIAVIGSEDDMGVELFMPDPTHGDTRVKISTTTVDLSAGVFRVDGGGEAVSLNENRSIEWSRHASGDLILEDGHVVGVERAFLEGAVSVSASGGSARGDELDVLFHSNGGVTSIRRAVFTGNAHAQNTEEQSLESDWLEVVFEAGQEDENGQARPTPSLVTARGGVVARQPDSITRADSLVAELESDSDRVWATRIELESELAGGVTYDATDKNDKRQTAIATRLIALPEREAITLFGSDETPAQFTSAGLRIVGAEIQANSERQTVMVFGSGQLTKAAGEDPDGTKRLDLSWSDEMAFDGRQGTIDGRGDIHAIITPDEFSRDTIEAHRLRVVMLPSENGELPSIPDAQDGEQMEKILEHIRSFEARGSVLYEDGGVDAIVRSRQYDQDGTLIRAVNLSGARIIGEPSEGSQTADTLRVPGKGRLVVMDETPPDSDEKNTAEGSAQSESGSSENSDMRGVALFDWNGSMTVSRATGRFEMLDNVRISHKKSSDQSFLYLVSDSVTGTAVIPAETNNPDAESDAPELAADGPLAENRIGALQEVILSGNVYARWSGREVFADRLTYDAAAGTIRAETVESARLTIVESARGVVVHAQTATWDLNTDEGQMQGVAPIVVPITESPVSDNK